MVRFHTPPIIYHGGEAGKADPILSIDFIDGPFVVENYNSLVQGILATGGGDGEIRIWRLPYSPSNVEDVGSVQNESGKAALLPVQQFPQFLFSCDGHQRSVNCLRFSPDKRSLAGGSDGGTVIIWNLAEKYQSWHQVQDQRELIKQLLRNTQDDLYDLGWSPDGTQLVTGSVDGSALVWDVRAGKSEVSLIGHSHYVQGVAWDPLNNYLVTQSSDRTCRVYQTSQGPKKGKKKPNVQDPQRFVCVQKLKERAYNLPSKETFRFETPQGTETPGHKEKQYHQHAAFLDETVPSFFRRLTWSPDGSFLIVPCGQYKPEPDSKPLFATYIFLRSKMDRPALCLPGIGKPSVAVKCCPMLFALKDTPAVNSLCTLPYRVVFAVLTLDQVLIYDTQHCTPIFVFSGLHYAPLSDLCWSKDGRTLIVASQDGYLSILNFDEEELGSLLVEDLIPECLKSFGKAQKSPGTTQLPSTSPVQLGFPGQSGDAIQTPISYSLVGKKKKKITPTWIGETSNSLAEAPSSQLVEPDVQLTESFSDNAKEISMSRFETHSTENQHEFSENTELNKNKQKKKARITPICISTPPQTMSGGTVATEILNLSSQETSVSSEKKKKRITPINVSSCTS